MKYQPKNTSVPGIKRNNNSDTRLGGRTEVAAGLGVGRGPRAVEGRDLRRSNLGRDEVRCGTLHITLYIIRNICRGPGFPGWERGGRVRSRSC